MLVYHRAVRSPQGDVAVVDRLMEETGRGGET
jgi:hypothetical protein